ncbi:MAG: SpoIID/LytB domain-containing protein [Oscillospiraceae bacterium]|nr:SpoIID/LytB domain-containing protein [Oscillospiraceae bacterium]
MKRLKKLIPLLLVVAIIPLLAPSTTQATTVTSNPIMRIGLAHGSGLLSQVRLENVVGSGFEIGTYSNGRIFTRQQSVTATAIIIAPRSGSATGITITNANTGAVLAQYDHAIHGLGIRPISTGTAETRFVHSSFRDDGAYRRFNGGFEFLRISGGNMRVVNVLPMQEYLRGVVQWEMMNHWHIDALRAQAIAARSFAFARPFRTELFSPHRGPGREHGFDKCATTCCQVYRGRGRATANTDRAVDETIGVYMFNANNNRVAMTTYHAMSGGMNENVSNVWVPGNHLTHPYLMPAARNFYTYESTAAAPYEFARNNLNWTRTFTNEQFTERLRGLRDTDGNTVAGNIVNAFIEERTPSDNVLTLTFVNENGQHFRFRRERARTVLGAPPRSQRFWIDPVGGQLADITTQSETGQSAPSSPAGMYVIGIDGTPHVIAADADLYVLTSGGLQAIGAGDNTGEYILHGSGWGNNIGMSQYGAQGMALAGNSHRAILQFFYPGVEIRTVS